MKKSRSIFFVLLALFLLPESLFGGNRWMMEKQAKQLIELNEQVMKKLTGVHGEKTVTLNARVKNQNGKLYLIIDNVAEQIDSEYDFSTEKSTPEYQSFIRFEPINETEKNNQFNTDSKGMTDEN